VNPGREVNVKPEGTQISCSIASLPIPLGRYYLWGAAYRNSMNGQELLGWQRLAQFDVHGPALEGTPGAIMLLSPVFVDSHWRVVSDDGKGAAQTTGIEQGAAESHSPRSPHAAFAHPG
jgi:hypothetical protein